MYIFLGGFGIVFLAILVKYYKSRQDFCLPFGRILKCSDQALKMAYDRFEDYPLTRIYPPPTVSHAKLGHTLIDITNPSKLPTQYLGRFLDHLVTPGMAPKYLKRVTLAVVRTNYKVALHYTSNESHLIIHFNPTNIRADLLASYINLLLAALPRGL